MRDKKDFPMPSRMTRDTKNGLLAFRCRSEVKEKLHQLIPDRSARAEWLERFLAYGLEELEKKAGEKDSA